MAYEEFLSYFFAATTIIGIIQPVGTNGKIDIPGDLETARAERTWEECIGVVTICKVPWLIYGWHSKSEKLRVINL